MLADPHLEELMGRLGEFGKYQLFQHILHVLGGFAAGLHMLTFVAVAPTPPHRCFIPGIDSENETIWDSPAAFLSIPKSPNGQMDSCHMYNDYNDTVICNKFVYDTSLYHQSKVMEWDLVCEDRWMRALAQALYMFGVLCGAVTLGSLADRVGRKRIFCVSGVLQLIFGLMSGFCPEYISYCVVRFIYGYFGSAGAYVTGFVLTMELVGPSRRTICGTAFQAAFALGVMLVAMWGAIISDPLILQIVFALHALVLIPHFWLVDESIRWLWSQGRVQEAVVIVEKGLRMNGGSDVMLDPKEYEAKALAHKRKEAEERGDDMVEGKKEVTYGVTDLFKTPNLRKKTLNACLNWMANSLAYYGLSLNTDKLEGNPYLLLFLVGLAEWPAYIIVVLLVDRVGRRAMLSSCMVAGGIVLLIATYIPAESNVVVNIVIALTMLGKLLIAASFAIIYNYTAELFPTVIRNSAVGIGSMCARFAGAITPFISLLDSVDDRLPSLLFGTLALVSGLLSLILPETLNQNLPQTIEDGELFGEGDTCCTAICGKKRESQSGIPLRNYTTDENKVKDPESTEHLT